MSGIRYELKDGIPLKHNAQLVYVSSERYGNDWHSLPHTHSCTELFYCVKGIGHFVINDSKQTVGSNDLIIINANTEHTEISHPQNPLEYIVLGIRHISFDHEDDSKKGWLSFNFGSFNDDIINLLHEILHELQYKRSNHEGIISSLTDVILTKIARYSKATLELPGDPSSTKECDIIKRYIDLNFRDRITLDELAELVHQNKFYLSHRFSEVFEMSPITYLFHKRLTESQYLLAHTNYSIAQISHTLGFSSPSYFSQQFKKKTGLSPSSYKKNFRHSEV